MSVEHVATLALTSVSHLSTWIIQEQPVGWDPISLWKQMGFVARAVVVILFVMSGWSIGVMIERWMAFNAARKQSRAFAPAAATPTRAGRRRARTRRC